VRVARLERKAEQQDGRHTRPLTQKGNYLRGLRDTGEERGRKGSIS